MLEFGYVFYDGDTSTNLLKNVVAGHEIIKLNIFLFMDKCYVEGRCRKNAASILWKYNCFSTNMLNLNYF